MRFSTEIQEKGTIVSIWLEVNHRKITHTILGQKGKYGPTKVNLL